MHQDTEAESAATLLLRYMEIEITPPRAGMKSETEEEEAGVDEGVCWKVLDGLVLLSSGLPHDSIPEAVHTHTFTSHKKTTLLKQ